MLREMAAREMADARRSLERLARPRIAWPTSSTRTCRRCAATPRGCCGSTSGAKRCVDANLRRISEELDNAWVELFAEIIADGVAVGVFRCADPVATAWRLCAMLDGFGLQVVLHQSTMTRAQMHKHVRRAAALELAYELPD